MRRIVGWGLLALGLLAGPARAGSEAAIDTAARGAELFGQRCAACHDHPQGSIPPRAWIATRPKGAIVEALTRGAMRAQANGLSGHEIDALADYLR